MEVDEMTVEEYEEYIDIKYEEAVDAELYERFINS